MIMTPFMEAYRGAGGVAALARPVLRSSGATAAESGCPASPSGSPITHRAYLGDPIRSGEMGHYHRYLALVLQVDAERLDLFEDASGALGTAGQRIFGQSHG